MFLLAVLGLQGNEVKYMHATFFSTVDPWCGKKLPNTEKFISK